MDNKYDVNELLKNDKKLALIEKMKKGSHDFRQLMTYYNCALMEIETKFRVLNQELSLQYNRNPIESIKTRIKSPESLVTKLIRKGVDLSLESVEQNIYDVAGIRIICSFPDDIFRLAESIKKQDDVTVIREKDYVNHPKPNGYRGLHLIIEIPIFLYNEKKIMKVEIQLRTIAMDFWASLEHKLHYKNQTSCSYSKEIEEELLQCSNIANQLDLKMQLIREFIENN